MVWFFHHVIVPILVIGVLVFIHEFGHFLLAKLCRVGVVKFSVGFGPAIFRVRRRETEYQIGAIPLGGFVRMVGDIPDMITGAQPTDDDVRGEASEEEKEEELSPELRAVLEDRSRWFIEKNFWQRSAIVIAGPLFNFLLAVVLVFGAVLLYGEENVVETARIGSVMKNSPAEKAGLKPGDIVHSIDGKAIDSWATLASTVHKGTGETLTLEVGREGKQHTLSVQPDLKEVRSYTGEKIDAYFIGIGPTLLRVQRGLLGAGRYGVLWTLDKTLLTYMGLWGMLTGQVSPKDLAGPLFILDAAGKQAKQGLENLLYFMALLSVSLAVLNLLPIPILDGGHLMFFIIEGIMGPVSMRKKEFAQQIGMLLLICLMVFALHNDIFRDTEAMKSQITWEEKKQEQEQKQKQVQVQEQVP